MKDSAVIANVADQLPALAVIKCGDISMAEYDLFHNQDGGSIPTSPLQFKFSIITQNYAFAMYKKWHYLGDTEFLSSVDYGAFYNGKCFGAISYGSPSAKKLKGYYNEKTQNGWWEIKRLAMDNIAPRNSESRFIAITIKLLKKLCDCKGIITMADTKVGHEGTIYKASGFKYLGLTPQKSDFWVNGKIKQRGKSRGINGEWIPRSRKHLYIKDFRVCGD